MACNLIAWKSIYIANQRRVICICKFKIFHLLRDINPNKKYFKVNDKHFYYTKYLQNNEVSWYYFWKQLILEQHRFGLQRPIYIQTGGPVHAIRALGVGWSLSLHSHRLGVLRECPTTGLGLGGTGLNHPLDIPSAGFWLSGAAPVGAQWPPGGSSCTERLPPVDQSASQWPVILPFGRLAY